MLRALAKCAKALPCPELSRCEQAEEKQKRTLLFHDLLQEQERAARVAKADRLSGFLDSDDEPDEDDSDSDCDDEHMTTTEETQSSHGPYTPAVG